MDLQQVQAALQVILSHGPYYDRPKIELSVLEKGAVWCLWHALVGELQHRHLMSLQLDHTTCIGKFYTI